MKLQHLYEQIFQTNPQSAALWKRQTHRLANSAESSQAPNVTFGIYNAQRRHAIPPSLADDLLASEPFRLLLIEPLTPADVTTRRNRLIRIFERAIQAMTRCEMSTGGHLDFQCLPQLGKSYHCGTDHMRFHVYNCHLGESIWEGRRILLVTQPGVIYTALM
ncbi:hypothetical protein BO94DRAFT_584896 [Aspergillus sclerotioniger CBS 115572]|uniref:Uncharacterized protein n=1 Tax=Aspergillus sclerotioniger CBS 115572 TaxID=1450535 RepID=A0A317WWG2_9EURO|nr:hypothetical protein BO94DRAFT_584896 [Aspergillus sclerotioniger CBS 115572]PWY89652.1 hypothetical protein BO94DRAFT_584896 [Aspergillus sclerotioniger CBS 115572]